MTMSIVERMTKAQKILMIGHGARSRVAALRDGDTGEQTLAVRAEPRGLAATDAGEEPDESRWRYVARLPGGRRGRRG